MAKWARKNAVIYECKNSPLFCVQMKRIAFDNKLIKKNIVKYLHCVITAENKAINFITTDVLFGILNR